MRSSGAPSVLVLSLRRSRRLPGFAANFEFEDILVADAGAELVNLPAVATRATYRASRATYKTLRAIGLDTRRAMRLAPAAARTRPSGHHYDLAVLVAPSLYDLFILRTVRHWHRLWDRLIVVVPELWPSELESPAVPLEPFELVDHFFVGGHAALSAFASATDQPFTASALGVDVLSFASRWDPSRPMPRPIFAANPGRRSPRQHLRLLDDADRREGVYLYDTLDSALITEPAAHRHAYARRLQATDVLVANYAKFDLPAVVGAAREVSGRVFEGLAAGCRLIGEAPHPSALHLAGLDGIVIHPFSLGGAPLPDLYADPDAVARERAGNLARVAATADWAHRWAAICDVLNLELTPAMRQRLDRLASCRDDALAAEAAAGQ